MGRRSLMETWTCHICGEERPDDKISVHSRTKVLEGGVEMQENVRYCNDRNECIFGATTLSFTPNMKEEGG